MIQTFRSLPEPAALAAHLGPRYGVTFEHCELRRTLVNDVYELATGDARYVLKLYLYGRREADEIRWETGLSAHLRAAGVRTTEVVPLLDGDTVGLLETPEGPRPFTLLEYVEGSTPRPPFTDELYDAFGRQVAAFHDAAENYTSPYFRPPAEDVDQALEQILAVDDAEENLLRTLTARVRNNLSQYSKAGTCHGDVSMDKVLLTPQGLLLLDFDLAATGPVAADFCGVATTPHWEAFKAGYRIRREITAEDEAAIPYLQIVGRILNLRFHVVDKPRYRGTESRGEGWAAGEYEGLRALL
ncbi:Ser/Thr protein kinase RdoA (MazF antagonist) [Kribbella aluminosa]|uniref:Ser/Thr protein kinase RdoA (MazF antagonist) n=1 Tax=Kribbella aluminosa TaxID=416017 RepID=A0ABS4UCX2_9ACTN|nr:phosphotransferase [Kribbella aluminosa]MBP2349425.1 Ser/Thr protein kinase RdoA (MazF antagonist) [Kribbella aluminosa]